MGDIDPGSDPIDLDAYDLDGLRQDLVELVDLQQLVLRTLQWTVLGPVAVGVVVWVYFSSRMPAWVLLPFDAVAVALSLVASVLAAVYIVLRTRVDAATVASGRVLDVLAMAHGDLERVAAGDAHLTVEQLATQVLEQAVVPGLRDGVVQTVPLPLRFLAGPLVWLPAKVVERTVVAVVERLPVAKLGRVGRDEATLAAEEVGRLRAAYASLPDDLANAKLTLTATVERVMATTSRPLIGLVIVALLPLLGWVVLGDALA